MASVERVRVGSSYERGEAIGRGVTGVVYRAVDVGSGRQLAIKSLHPHLVGDVRAMGRFMQERQALSRLSHPNVVGVVELVVEGEQLSIVMELVEGGDLKELSQRTRIGPALAVGLATGIASGLAAIHAAGVVHRDLKPANVLIDQGSGALTPKITDFGLSRLVEEGLSRSSTTVGTPLYMAPEAAELAVETSTPADVYALGVILFELLTGAPPFSGGGALAVLKAHATEPAPTIVGVPAALAGLIDEMLAKNPLARPSAAQVHERLLAIGPQLSDEMRPVAQRQASPDSESPTVLRGTDGILGSSGQWQALPVEQLTDPPRRRLPIVAGIGVAAAIAVLGVLTVALAVGSREPEQAGVVGVGGAGYAFDPELLEQGQIVSRRWFLSSNGESLRGEVTVLNPGDAPLDTELYEVFPASSGIKLDDAVFVPEPADVFGDDLAVRFAVADLGPGQVAEFTYDATLARGEVSLSRLEALAADKAEASAAFFEGRDISEPERIRIARLAVEPSKVELTVGRQAELQARAKLADGVEAPPDVLSGAVWSSDNPDVVDVTGSRITGAGAGTAVVTVRLGDAVATVPVTVNAAPAPAVAAPPPSAPTRTEPPTSASAPSSSSSAPPTSSGSSGTVAAATTSTSSTTSTTRPVTATQLPTSPTSPLTSPTATVRPAPPSAGGDPRPVISGPTSVVCQTSAAQTFTVDSASGTMSSFQWSVQSGPEVVSGATSKSVSISFRRAPLAVYTVTVTVNGRFADSHNVRVVEGQGCTLTGTSLPVDPTAPEPQIQIEGPGSGVCFGPWQTYRVVNLNGVPITSYNWNTGGLGIQSPFTAAEIRVSFDDDISGTFVINVTVNEKVTASKSISVSKPPEGCVKPNQTSSASQ